MITFTKAPPTEFIDIHLICELPFALIKRPGNDRLGYSGHQALLFLRSLSNTATSQETKVDHPSSQSRSQDGENQPLPGQAGRLRNISCFFMPVSPRSSLWTLRHGASAAIPRSECPQRARRPALPGTLPWVSTPTSTISPPGTHPCDCPPLPPEKHRCGGQASLASYPAFFSLSV